MKKFLLSLLPLILLASNASADSGAFMANPYHAVTITASCTSGSGAPPSGTYIIKVDTSNSTGGSSSQYPMFTVVWNGTTGTGSVTAGAGPSQGSQTWSNPTLWNGSTQLTQYQVTMTNGGFSWNMNINAACTNGTTNFVFGGVQLPVQPITISAVSKNNQSVNGMFEDPNGNDVLTFGVGSNQTYSNTYQPQYGAPTGVWYLMYVTGIGTHQQKAVLATVTLTATPNDPTYSAKWSSINLAGTIPGSAGGNNVGPQGSFTNNSGRSITLQWTDSGGNVVATQTVANGSTAALTAPTVTLPNGTAENLTLTDTTDGKTLGGVTIFAPSDGQPGSVQGTITGTANPPPASNPTPTPQPTNTGNNSTGVTTTTTAGNTSVNNGNTSISGAAAGATNQDIYNDVKQALLDASQGNPSGGSDGQMPADAQVTDLTGAKADAAAVQSWAQTQVNTGSSGFLAAPTAPTIGTTSAGFTMPAVGPMSAITIDWSGYSSMIGIFRALCLIAMTITFWLANQRAVNNAIA